jgi:hypothetical protein
MRTSLGSHTHGGERIDPVAIMATAARVDGDDEALLHLAGVTFKDDAEALERRLLGAR